jgi:arylsulfate sulfotransferase
MKDRTSGLVALLCCWGMFLQGCDHHSTDSLPVTPAATQASLSDITTSGSLPGVTPFIAFLELRGGYLAKVARIAYQIEPIAGTASRRVSVIHEMEVLRSRGYFVSDGVATLPVFGLYANHSNHVLLDVVFKDRSVQRLSISINTNPWVDPNGAFDRPVIRTRRAVGSVLGFDFIAMKSFVGTPVVVDTDGYVRWVATGIPNSAASAFADNGFFVGSYTAPVLYRLELDGSLTQRQVLSSTYTAFHHNIDPGKEGLLVELDTNANGVSNVESTVAEVTASGVVLKEWDLAAIFTAYMQSQGDNAAAFVRPGTDWLHTNAVTYDRRDDSLIVSSRENFLFKIDYESGRLLWILGDPTKYWYTFPSLRAKALGIAGDGLYPIGQHATSITSDGLLMVFNNGAPSFNQPVGAAVGEARAYSAVSAYSIDAANQSAREMWRFDYQQSIRSDICSSSYEAPGGSLLLSYAAADNRTRTRLVGLSAGHDLVFDIEFANPAPGCPLSWNAHPVPFDDLHFK